jgi:hypothetical protein
MPNTAVKIMLAKVAGNASLRSAARQPPRSSAQVKATQSEANTIEHFFAFTTNHPTFLAFLPFIPCTYLPNLIPIYTCTRLLIPVSPALSNKPSTTNVLQRIVEGFKRFSCAYTE